MCREHYVLVDVWNNGYVIQHAIKLPSSIHSIKSVSIDASESNPLSTRKCESLPSYLPELVDKIFDSTTYDTQYGKLQMVNDLKIAYVRFPIKTNCEVLFAMKLEVPTHPFRRWRFHVDMFLISNRWTVICFQHVKVDSSLIKKFMDARLSFEECKTVQVQKEGLLKFLDWVEILERPMIDWITRNDLCKVQRIFEEFQLSTEVIKPFYANVEKDFTAQYDPIRNEIVCKHGEVLYSCNPFGIFSDFIEGKSEDIKREIRKAYEVFSFLHDGKTGLNPRDGKFYKNGQEISCEPRCHYASSIGIRVFDPSKGRIRYYVPCDGYYVRAIRKYDHGVMKQIENQYRLLTELMN